MAFSVIVSTMNARTAAKAARLVQEEAVQTVFLAFLVIPMILQPTRVLLLAYQTNIKLLRVLSLFVSTATLLARHVLAHQIQTA